MPSSFFLYAALIAVCWGTWPSIMKFSTAPPIVKAFMFSGVTFMTVLVPFLASERGVYAGSTRVALLIAAACGLMNGFGTLRYQALLDAIPAHMTSTFVTAMLVAIILVAVAAGVVIHREPVTLQKLVFFGLATLTLIAAGYAGLEDARLANEKNVQAALVIEISPSPK